MVFGSILIIQDSRPPVKQGRTVIHVLAKGPADVWMEQRRYRVWARGRSTTVKSNSVWELFRV